MRKFLAAVRFLTIVPLPGPRGGTVDDLAGSVPFFPVVGLILGATAAALARGLGPLGVPSVSAAMLVVLLLGFSGCLHIDGLSDTADGFLSSRSRERILEIMKDSHIGAMGVVAVVCVLLLKFAALASLDAQNLWPAALLMPLAGRVAMVVHMMLLPSVRPGGLGSIFCNPPRAAAVWSAAVLGGVAVAMLHWRGIAIWAACIVVTLLLAAYCRRKIGGATGDTFGAVCEIVEIVPALFLAFSPLPAVR